MKLANQTLSGNAGNISRHITSVLLQLTEIGCRGIAWSSLREEKANGCEFSGLCRSWAFPAAPGDCLLLLGVLLFARRMKVVGIVASLVGLGLMATPFLALLYFVIAVQSM